MTHSSDISVHNIIHVTPLTLYHYHAVWLVSLRMTVHKIIHVTPLTYHYHAVWLTDMTVHKIIHVTPLTHHYHAVWLISSDMSVHELLYHAVQVLQLIRSDMSVHKILPYVIVTSLNYYHAAWFISSHITLSVQYIIMNFPFFQMMGTLRLGPVFWTLHYWQYREALTTDTKSCWGHSLYP